MADLKGMAKLVMGAVAPKLAEVTDEVLFADIWERSELPPRERSLITVASLITQSRPEQLAFHLERALGNGVTKAELAEVATHLAFYAGWPAAASAVALIGKLEETCHSHASR